MLAGVTIHDPYVTWIDATVEIGPDVAIEPNVILRGATHIGRDTVIRAGSQIDRLDHRRALPDLGAA